ncbi:MAG: Sec-independent protein translocase protein TatB [Candidatus Accumulibacter sp.]|jgi:sec-independent protein translocase protein TatB|nr:Sec-independent protein translocase protein TatB [Accumulibacter sp.]
MFDIGFSELVVIGVVALIVVGPERLPRVARTAGLLLGRMQRYVNDVKADIGREMQIEELKKLQSEVQQSARDFERNMRDEIKAVEQNIGQTVDAVKNDLGDIPPADRPATPPPQTSPGEGAPGEAPRE